MQFKFVGGDFHKFTHDVGSDSFAFYVSSVLSHSRPQSARDSYVADAGGELWPGWICSTQERRSFYCRLIVIETR